MEKKQLKNSHFGARPRDFFCLYSHHYIIRGCYNQDCKCAHCSFHNNCNTCVITHDPKEIRRRDSMCADCIRKTREIQERIAAEKQQMEKTK